MKLDRSTLTSVVLLLCIACLTLAPVVMAQAPPPLPSPPRVPQLPPGIPGLFGLMENPPPPPRVTGPVVVTDQADYAPGATAHINGKIFQAGETIRLQVLHADGTPASGEDHQPWTVVADEFGAFHAAWHVCEDDCVGSSLRLTAVGVASGRTAQALFTDAPATPTFELLKSFGTVAGWLPRGLIMGTDGALYGTTQEGGKWGFGTIFKLNPDGTGFTELRAFDAYTTGGYPGAGLMQGADGALYGSTYFGGDYGGGTVFKVSTDGTGFIVLKHFDYYTTGGYLRAGLIQAADGALYGTASQGGISDSGTVFRLNTDGTSFSVLKEFDSLTTGAFPGSLIQATDGALYGRTSGIFPNGTLFKLNTDGTGFTILKEDFDWQTTGGPPIRVMQGTDGSLYGTTYLAVFKLNTDGTAFTVLKSNDDYVTAGYYLSGLLQGADGALYGTAGYGGSYGNGTVFKLNTDGTGFTVLKGDFDNKDGRLLESGLVQGTDGTLYGVALEGGISGQGTVFKLNPDGTGFRVLKTFVTYPEGVLPKSGVMQGSDGSLYGTTAYGGSSGSGTVFKLNADGSGFNVLKNLDEHTTGTFSNPFGRSGELIQGADGVLYGTCVSGGQQEFRSDGTVFELNTDGSGFDVIKEFEYDSDGLYRMGRSPYGKLMQASDGALYGTASRGGGTNAGAVFKLNPDGSGYSIIKSFGSFFFDGSSPSSELIQGTDGALYGTAQTGGIEGYYTAAGTIFKINPDGTGFTVLKTLNYTSGNNPNGLIQGTDGALYGTTQQGGNEGGGTAFKLNPDGTGFQILKHFDFDTTGNYLQAGLIQAADGALYGTASLGGSGGGGTVYKLNMDGTGFTVLANFDDSTNGGYVRGRLFQGTDGVLYGTATQGGSDGYGTLFKLNPDGTDFSVLKNFDDSSGSSPVAGLVRATNGALYGTASQGGSHGQGTLFKLNTDGSGFVVLRSLFTGADATDGAYPSAGLVQGSDGALYGTAQSGGSYGYGTVFKLNLDGTGFNVLASFDYSTTGAYPEAELLQGLDGSLYGTAHDGGTGGSGTIFKLSPDGSDFSVLKSLDYYTTGAFPTSALVQTEDGTLYGTARGGGGLYVGTVFQLSPDGSDFSVLLNFDYWIAGGPLGGLTKGVDGNLYGTTTYGGNGGGTVYRLVFGGCSGAANGTTCDDGNACTQTDTCQAGTCVGGNPVTCTANDQCHDAGTCDTHTGVCSNPVRSDGAPCSDGNACTQTDTCQAGTCRGGNYSWSGVLQPINADGSSVFKLGSTIPTKFQLTGACASNTSLAATIYFYKVANSEGPVNEATSTSAADTGTTFRYSNGQYIFNLGTKGLTEGSWSLGIDLHDSMGIRVVTVGLRK